MFRLTKKLPRPVTCGTLCHLPQLHLQPPYHIAHALNLLISVLLRASQICLDLLKLFLIIDVHRLHSFDEGLQSILQGNFDLDFDSDAAYTEV